MSGIYDTVLFIEANTSIGILFSIHIMEAVISITASFLSITSWILISSILCVGIQFRIAVINTVYRLCQEMVSASISMALSTVAVSVET